LRITHDITIGDDEIRLEFVRSSGPGGQNVNKVATAAQLRFDVATSPSLPEDVKRRLARVAGNRINTQGVLVIDARRFRSQTRNRKDAEKRLAEWIRRAAAGPKRRRKTKPTAASKRRRLEQKRRRSETKRLRRDVPPE